MAAYVPRPHFWLLSEPDPQRPHGGWRFILRASDGTKALEAADAEPDARGERLELLAVVRGLEAIDQPSRVTLITPSSYVKQGLVYGLHEWRDNGWMWERFGELAPVKHRDLWQRLDRALKYHEVDCRTIRIDRPHTDQRAPTEHELEARPETKPHPALQPATRPQPRPQRRRARSPRQLLAALRRRYRVALLRRRRELIEQVDGWRLWLEQLGLVAVWR